MNTCHNDKKKTNEIILGKSWAVNEDYSIDGKESCRMVVKLVYSHPSKYDGFVSYKAAQVCYAMQLR